MKDPRYIDRSSSYYEMKYDWKPEKEKHMIKFWLAKSIAELIITLICVIIYVLIIAWVCRKGK